MEYLQFIEWREKICYEDEIKAGYKKGEICEHL